MPKEKFPPVILNQKELWSTVSKILNDALIAFSKAKAIPEGISIHPSSSEDYRSIIIYTISIKRTKAQCYTYQFSSEKLLHVILRRVPEAVNDTNFIHEFQENGIYQEQLHDCSVIRTNLPCHLSLSKGQKLESVNASAAYDLVMHRADAL